MPTLPLQSHGPLSTSKDLRLAWFHRYPARFPTEVVTAMFAGVEERLGRVPQIVLDPFAGSGTTLAAARQLGIASIGVEISDVGILITKVRLFPPRNAEQAREIVEGWLDRPPRITVSRIDPTLESWLGARNASLLSSYMDRWAALTDIRIKRFAALAISSALRPASRWLPGSIKPQIDPTREPPALDLALRRSVRALARDCEYERFDPPFPRTRVLQGDATQLRLQPDSVDAVITSPPYFITYDYYDVHRLSYLAFGWEMRSDALIGQRYNVSKDGAGFVPPVSMVRWYGHEFRGEGTVEGRALRLYIQRLSQHLDQVELVLRSGGIVAYAVANSTRRQAEFDLVSCFVELLSRRNFCQIEVVPRTTTARRILPVGRSTTSGRFDGSGEPAVKEFVVYACKGNVDWPRSRSECA